MSTDLAIAGVTAVLRSLLQNGTVFHETLTSVGAISVTAKPPDRVDVAANDLADQINVFMYHVEPNAGWRNWELPSRDSAGVRTGNPILALDLYYLVTAYSRKELFDDVLLGYAMRELHEVGVLTRTAINAALQPAPPEVPGITPADLLDQVELIKLVPHVMNTEEMSKLWMAFTASYRPSAAYHASVLLIENRQPARSAPPVLTVGPFVPALQRPAGVTVNADMQPPLPTLVLAVPPNQQPTLRMGEILTLTGFHLADGPAVARFTESRTGTTIDVPATGTATSLQVAIPAASPLWRVGFYTVQVLVTPPVGGARTTNSVALAFAPTIGAMSKTVAAGKITLTVPCNPKVGMDQRISCIFGDREVFPEPFSPDPTDTLVFVFDESDILGHKPWVRLRVDGVESILIDYAAATPAFVASQLMP